MCVGVLGEGVKLRVGVTQMPGYCVSLSHYLGFSLLCPVLLFAICMNLMKYYTFYAVTVDTLLKALNLSDL